MKRNSYVDSSGNSVDAVYESKKTLLKIFFIFGTIIPIILIIVIIVLAIMNINCKNFYKKVEEKAYKYAKENKKLPSIAGTNVKIDINDLYNDGYLFETDTGNQKITGYIKITKYKTENDNKYLYTPSISGCKICNTNRYGKWSNEVGYRPNKAVVDVIPYYNYYEREVNQTKWSDYIEEDDLSKERSEYGVYLPEDENKMPTVPSEEDDNVNILRVETEEKILYSYRDKQWKWYDIVGDYSEYTSEKPNGYKNRDDSSLITTEWTEYSQNYPEEHPYRSIKRVEGYKYYYENESGEKIYANNGEYTPEEDVDTEKYTERETGHVTLYKYSDSKWRWYNGEKRNYSNYRSTKEKERPYKEVDTEKWSNYSTWKEKSSITDANKAYRDEITKVQTRFSYVYEYLSNIVLDEYLTKQDFQNKISMSLKEFNNLEEYKIDVKYKFKYRK